MNSGAVFISDIIVDAMQQTKMAKAGPQQGQKKASKVSTVLNL